MKKPIKEEKPTKKIPKQLPPSASQLEELMKSEIYLYQFCNDMSAKVAGLELRLQNALNKIATLEKNDESLRNVLEVIGTKIKDLKEEMMGDPDGEFGEDTEVEVFKREPPMHDDVTVACEVCNKIFHAKMKKCPNCGYNRFEGR